MGKVKDGDDNLLGLPLGSTVQMKSFRNMEIFTASVEANRYSVMTPWMVMITCWGCLLVLLYR